MKLFLSILILLLVSLGFSYSQSPSTLDTALARKLGADEYGQKVYYMGFLKTGPAQTTDTTFKKKTFEGHMENIVQLANEGKIIVAGPFLDKTDLEGFFIYNVHTKKEAQELADTDPAVKAGFLTIELHPYYGSAVLQLVPEWHKKVQAKSF